MQRFYLAVFVLSIIGGTAYAQQQPPTPMEQALGQKLQNEYNENLQLRAALITMQSQIAELKKQIPDKPADATPPK